MDTATALPDVITAGTTVTYERTLSDFPASDGWALTLYLAGPAVLSSSATASGTKHVVTLTATETGALDAGLYRYEERVERTGVVHAVASGTITVRPNLATAAAGDQASWEEQALAAVRAAIRGQMTARMARFQILGRVVEYMTPKELRETEVWLANRVARRRPGAKAMQRVGFTFTGTPSDS